MCGACADPEREPRARLFAGPQAQCSPDARALGHYLRVARTVILGESDTATVARTTAIAVSPSGLIAVADDGEGNVKVYGPDGALVRVLGRRGSGPGEFRMPTALAFLDSSTIVVADDVRSKLVFIAVEGQLLHEEPLPSRRVGGIVRVENGLVLAGYARADGDTGLSLLTATDLSGRRPEVFGPIPASYWRHGPLLAGPGLVAGPSEVAPYYATWRFANEVWHVPSGGTRARPVQLPNHKRFVDPRRVLAEAREPGRDLLFRRASPIVALAASTAYVVVSYYSPFSGDSRVGMHILDPNLRPIATNVAGALLFVGRADTLIGGAPADSGVPADSPVRLAWYVPCR